MDEMKAKLTRVLSLQPLGTIAMAELAKQYKQTNKEKLDFKGLGFESLQKLLEAMPDAFQVKYDKKSSDYRVLLVNYEVNEAIEKEISNQSQRTNSLDTSYATGRFDSYDDCQRDSFVDRTRTNEDGHAANHLRRKPIPTAFRGQNDWELFIRNFPNGTKESDLMDVFKTFGCTRMRIKTKRENETQFAFATFRDYSEAEVAYVTLDGTEFKGRPLSIAFAKSSIAPEDEVRGRLEKTQFTTEVTSSRHRRFSSDNEGSVDRRSADQPDHLNCRRSTSHVEPRCHSPHGTYAPWQPFTGPGNTTTEDRAQTHREVGALSTRSNGRMTINTNPKQAGQEEANCTNGENSSDKEELICDRKSRIKSNSSRTDVVGARDRDEGVAVVERMSDDRQVGKFDHLEQKRRSEQLYDSSQRNGIRDSERTAPMFTESKFDRRHSDLKEAREALDERGGTDEISKNQRHLVSVKSDEETERHKSVSAKETRGQLDSSTNSELPCMTECRSNGSKEISSETELRYEIVRPSLETFKRDSEAGTNNTIRDGEDRNGCPISNTNRISDISLQEIKNNATFTSDTLDAEIARTEANIELSSGVCRANRHGGIEKWTIDTRGNKENCSVLSRDLKTSSGIAPRRLRVYIRDEIFLVKNIIKWTKGYSRNGLDLGQLKCQCKPLTQFEKSSLPVFPNSSAVTANISKPETEIFSNDSNSTAAKTLSTSNTSIINQVESSFGKCCENIPETMDVRFLQEMLDESRIKQGFLSHKDLPDKLDLIVIHVCNSNHFWGSVINSGEFMDEYEDLFQMMNDIAVKARPEYRLDKATVEDKRAGVLYQETDWCRVWIKSPAESSEVEVFYVDYGNSEFRSRDALWILPRKAWELRPMVLPFHLTGSLAEKTLFEMVNTKITVKLIRPQPLDLGFVVAVRPYKELDSVDTV